MKAPPRLSNPTSNASDLLRLLVQAGQTDLPDAERLRMVSARLGPLAGAGIAGAAGGGGALGGAAAKGFGAAAALKVGAAVTLVVAVGGAAVVGVRQTQRSTKDLQTPGTWVPENHAPALPLTARSLPAPSVAPSGSASDQGAPGAAPALVAAPRRTPAPLPTTRTSMAATASSALDEKSTVPSSAATGSEPSAETEVALLQAAQAALRDNPTAALALANRHAGRFPSGALAQEREVIAIEALLAVHQRDEANERAARFAREFPNSAHRPRIEALLRAFDHNP